MGTTTEETGEPAEAMIASLIRAQTSAKSGVLVLCCGTSRLARERVHHDGLIEAFDSLVRRWSGQALQARIEASENFVGDQDFGLKLLVQLLDASRDIYGIADGRILELVIGRTYTADHDLTGMNADADR